MNATSWEFEAARAVIPGGVDSPVRAFGSVGGTPRFIASASGAHVTDAEGRNYMDLVGSWNPALLGHAHPEVVIAVQEAVARGLSFGAPTATKTLLAKEMKRAATKGDHLYKEWAQKGIQIFSTDRFLFLSF